LRNAMCAQDLSTRPFNLDRVAIAWVDHWTATFTLQQKIRQLLHMLCRDLSQNSLDHVIAQQVGGAHRMLSRAPEQLRSSATYLQSKSVVPMLLSGDLELSERFSIYTALPNQMGVAAAGGDAALWAGRIAAREARELGFNWAFGPVLDLDLNPASAVVNTRSFGSEPDKAAANGTSWITGIQSEGLAATGKHWPGDGVDSRDQHLVTSCNSLEFAQWKRSCGKPFQAAIDAGVMSIMASHIRLDGYEAAKGQPFSWLPASLNRALTQDLLRSEMGFAGLVISEAAQMAGYTALGPPEMLLPDTLLAGCDMILFPEDVDEAVAILERAILGGRVPQTRIDEALRRVLATKAALGLHKQTESWASTPATEERRRMHQEISRTIAQNSITLIRDDQAMLPLLPSGARRLLLLSPPRRESASGDLPSLVFDAMLREEGFSVETYVPGEPLEVINFDAALYVIGDEAGSAKPRLDMPWAQLHGPFPASMTRLWNKIPTAIISFGTPYYLHDAPECRTLINAYSPTVSSQRAVVDALVGRIPFKGSSPVDVEWRPIFTP
jgi:beta-N-acetylhexosaminidase